MNRSALATPDPRDLLANCLDVDAIAGQATGFTGADIANRVNEAERRRRTIFRQSSDSRTTSKYADFCLALAARCRATVMSSFMLSPCVDPDWLLAEEGVDPAREREVESLTGTPGM
jgi:hypothetical protein